MIEACTVCSLPKIDCTCYIEDLPDVPFYNTRYCIRGPQYKVLSGSELDGMSVYELYAEKWYDTPQEAEMARRFMIKAEMNKLSNRLQALNKMLNS